MLDYESQYSGNIRESMETCSAVVEFSPDSIFVIQNEIVKIWNRAAENLFGVRKSEAINQPLEPLLSLHATFWESYKRNISEVIKKGNIKTFEAEV